MKLTLLLAILVSTVNAQTREIAVTIDDLPVVSTRSDIETRRSITRKLVGHVKAAKIPAIGFVNEGKLYVDGKRDEAQVDLLRIWLAAGLELGNHTYSHMNLGDNPLEAFEADILKGEIITKEILGEKGLKIRFFRHPYLWTGLSLEIKRDLGRFLYEHGYTIAPVTVDNADWIFARAYDNAFDKKDKAMMSRIGAAYVPYLTAKLDYFERQSVKTLGREIRQILLIHANRINSEYLDDLAKAMKKRKYRFVALEAALKDEAYKLPDNFVKRNGISWLHRWALDKGKDDLVPDEPRVPEFVMKYSGFDSE
jgi:peptidoglycan/xylan/chitin deacetylase (PgdA/CDA1 family)